jgi:hypothetical protein
MSIGDNVYIYFGHASDICYKNGDLALTPVPNDTYYVSKSSCGLVTTVRGLDENLYVDASGALQRPETPAHKKLLETRFDSALEIHKPGEEIVESRYNSFGFYPPFKKGMEIFMIYNSGLRHYSAANDYKRIKVPLREFKLTDLVPKDVIFESYKGAIFPDTETLTKVFTKDFYTYEDLIKLSKNDDLRTPVKKLINRYKGIHYMLLCREIHESCKKEAFKRRLYSAEKHDTHWNTFKRIMRFERDKKNIEKYMSAIKNKAVPIPSEDIENIYLKTKPDRWKYINALRWKEIRNIAKTKKNKSKSKSKKEAREVCQPGQVRDAITKKCREKVKRVKNVTRSNKKEEAKAKAKAKANAKACPPGQVRNAFTKNCREKRKPGPKPKEKA